MDVLRELCMEGVVEKKVSGIKCVWINTDGVPK